MPQVSDKRFEELFRHKKPINFGVVTEESVRSGWGDHVIKVVYELWCADESGKITMKLYYPYPVSAKGIEILKRLFALYEMDNSWIDSINTQIELEIQYGHVIPYNNEFEMAI